MLREYKISKFIECKNFLTFLKKKNMDQENSIINYQLNYFKDKFQLKNKFFYLTWTTLLNWYEKCELSNMNEAYISIDLDQFNEKKYDFSYKNNFLKSFLNINLNITNLEWSIGNSKLKMFITFEYNKTHMYHSNQIISKLIGKISEFCSIELIEKKYLIPCNVEKTLI